MLFACVTMNVYYELMIPEMYESLRNHLWFITRMQIKMSPRLLLHSVLIIFFKQSKTGRWMMSGNTIIVFIKLILLSVTQVMPPITGPCFVQMHVHCCLNEKSCGPLFHSARHSEAVLARLTSQRQNPVFILLTPLFDPVSHYFYYFYWFHLFLLAARNNE
jgi:hypothetical protein